MKKFSRKYLTPLLKYVLPPLVWLWIQVIRRLSRFKCHGLHHCDELDRQGKAYIIAYWHSRQFVLPFIPNNREVHCLISASHDGTIATGLMRLFGKTMIRGSSSKDGMAAMMAMMRVLRDAGVVAVSPDGPRGPAFKTKPGIIQMAQSLNVPIIAMSFDNNRKKVLSSWDSFYLPRPFGKINIVMREPVYIDTHSTIEQGCQALDDELMKADDLARRLTLGQTERHQVGGE